MQSHLECRLWNEVFVEAQRELGIPNGEGGPQRGRMLVAVPATVAAAGLRPAAAAESAACGGWLQQ